MTQHIAFYLPTLDGGDGASATYNLACELRRRDCSLQLFTMQASERDAAFAEISDVTVLDSKPTGFAVPALLSAVRAKAPDILVAISTPCIQAAAVAKRLGLLRPRLIGWEHFLPATVLDPEHSAAAPLIRWLYRACDDLLLPSAQAKEMFASQLAGKPAPDLHLVQPAIAAPQSPITPGGNTVLTRLKAPVIASAGSFDRAYDFKLLMRAFQYFSRTNDGTLLLIGDGAGRTALESAATGFGLGDRVVFTSDRANVEAYLARADLYVSTLHPSSFDHALVQALRLGLPTIASDAAGGAPREILADGRYGKLAPDGDARALARAIQDLITAPKNPEAQRNRGAEFSVARAADTFLAAIDATSAGERAAA